MTEEQQQLMQAMDELLIASKTFAKKRRKIVTPLHLRWSLHVLLLMIPFGVIMAWQIARLANAPLDTFCIYVLITFFVAVYASLYVVHRTAVGKRLDALDAHDYQEFPELQQAVHDLRIKNLQVQELSQKLQKSSYAK